MLAKTLILAAGIAALLLLLLWVFQRALIYFPMGVVGQPEDWGLHDAKVVRFATEDGLTLSGWVVPARKPPASFTVLVFNGNGGNRALRAPLAEELSWRGMDVLLFDYRGYGGNPGRPTEAGLMADARAARAYLVEAAGADPRRLVLFGESIGTGVAVPLAIEHPPAALILRSPFTSLVDMGRQQFFFLPLDWIMRDQYRSLDRIGRLRCPLLVIAGTGDTIVPYRQSAQLFQAAPEPKRLVTLPADHNDLELLAGERMIDAIEQFLRDTASR